jgi:hypothetical protein
VIAFDRYGIPGSMVLIDRMYIIFMLYERKNDIQEKISTALPQAQRTNYVSRNTINEELDHATGHHC